MSVLQAFTINNWTDRNVCPTSFHYQQLDRQECLSYQLSLSTTGQTGMSVLLRQVDAIDYADDG
jgi:hypothetical protein